MKSIFVFLLLTGMAILSFAAPLKIGFIFVGPGSQRISKHDLRNVLGICNRHKSW